MKRGALFIGVNRYEDPEMKSLEWCENDAIELFGFFKNVAGYEDVRNLLNPDSEKVLDTAHEMAEGMEAGDLFLIYFSGHGMQHGNSHLLLCPGVKYSRIKYLQQAIPLELLREETQKRGLNRMIVLDTCRSELVRGVKGTGEYGLKDVSCIKEVFTRTGTEGSDGVLCSCDAGQQSREVAGCKQGLFSMALLQVLREASNKGDGIAFSDDLERDLSARMHEIGKRYGVKVEQRPWVQKSGEMPLIIEGRNKPAEPMQKRDAQAVRIVEQEVATKPVIYTPQIAPVSSAQSFPEDREIIIPGSQVPLKMRLIPAGSFKMGSPKSEDGRSDDEGPQHEVTISKPFYMGTYPVTQAQWRAVMGNNPSKFKGDDDRPVESVSWIDCIEFTYKMNRMGMGTFRLPTEAEWEYACRAGSETRFPWGDDDSLLRIFAWYSGNANSSTHPVGQKEPNEWGLYDMHGNVWEWCSDWYGSYYTGFQRDPKGAAGGTSHVLRGGSYTNDPQFCRSAHRFSNAPSFTYSALGFRLVRNVP